MEFFPQICRLLLVSCLLLPILEASPLVTKDKMEGVDLHNRAYTWLAPSELSLTSPCNFEPRCITKEYQPVVLSHGVGPFVVQDQALFLMQSLVNPSEQTQDFLITMEWPATDEVAMVLSSSGHNFVERSAHFQDPLTKRDYPIGKLNLRLTLPPGESKIVLKLQPQFLYNGRVKIWDFQAIEDKMRTERIVVWMFYGMFFALILSLFSIYWTNQNISALWGAAALIFLVLFDQVYRGYFIEVFEIFQVEVGHERLAWLRLYGIVAIAFFSKTIATIHDLKTLAPKLRRIFDWQCYFSILSLVPALAFSTEVGIIVLFVVNISIFTLIWVFAYWQVKAGISPISANFIVGLPFIIGSATYIGHIFGYLEISLIYDTGLLWGYALLTLGLSYNYGQQYMKMTQEKLKALLTQESINASLEVAKVVQQNLLPVKKLFGFQTYEFYRPAEIVGGDSYYFNARDDLVFLAIFDVTGHGISSAIITGTLAGAMHEIFHHEVKQKAKPAEILHFISVNLNDTILDYNQGRMDHLVTMSSGLLDLQNQRFYFLNAGHIASYLIKPSRVVTLVVPGSPLGLRKDPIFEVKDYPLEVGDKILFLTDGILENATSEGKVLKESELLKKLQTQRTLDAHSLGLDLESYLDLTFDLQTLEDDMTFLLIGKSKAP